LLRRSAPRNDGRELKKLTRGGAAIPIERKRRLALKTLQAEAQMGLTMTGLLLDAYS
jgi:hypothetical protein